MTTRILLADDHALVRRGLRLILDGERDLRVVAEAGDGAEAVEKVAGGGVDLAILDIAMPRMTGLQAAREMSRSGRASRRAKNTARSAAAATPTTTATTTTRVTDSSNIRRADSAESPWDDLSVVASM